MGRPHTLDADPERIEILAQMLSEGVPRRQIADTLGVKDVTTITEWKKRPDVQAKVTALIQARANNILAHTDTAIAARLAQAAGDNGKPIPLPDLLQIRRTYAGEKLTIDNQGDAAKAVSELMAALHADPEKAQAFIDASAVEVDAEPD